MMRPMMTVCIPVDFFSSTLDVEDQLKQMYKHIHTPESCTSFGWVLCAIMVAFVGVGWPIQFFY